jgi:ABC-type multidrug transport system fused ATPase/permease subunit
VRKVFGIWTTLPRAFPYVRPYRKLGGSSIGFTFAAACVALAEPWPLAIMVDSVLGERRAPGVVRWIFGGEPGLYTLLVFAVVAGFLLTFFTHGVTVLADWVSAKLEQRMVLDLRSDLFDHCQGLSLTFHDNRFTGQLMNQVNMQASALGAIVVAFPLILQSILTLIGMFVVTLLIAWQVALVSLVAVPIIWFSLGLYGTRIVPRLQRVQSLEWQSLSIVHEAMSMLRVIVSFGREKHESRRFREQGEVAVEERIKLTVRQTLFSLAVTSATAIGTGLVLGVGAWLVIRKQISLGELLVLIAYVASIYQPLEQIANTIGDLNDQFVQFNSSLDLLDEEKEVKEAPDGSRSKTSASPTRGAKTRCATSPSAPRLGRV